MSGMVPLGLVLLVVTALVPQQQPPQSMPPPKTQEAARLKAGEIVRFFKTGGFSKDSGCWRYWSLIAIQSDGTVDFRNPWVEKRFCLTAQHQQMLEQGLQAIDIVRLRKNRRKEKYPPSENDGYDVYVNFVKKGKRLSWNNIQYNAPDKEPLLELLLAIELLAGRGAY